MGMDKTLADWENGLTTTQETVRELECAIMQFFDTLARGACSDNRPHDVHFYVEAQRKASRLFRQVEQRLPSSHRY
jgi:hypothetical protein